MSFLLLRVVYGVCYITGFIQNVFYSSQLILMGFYQLSRLYYCFSKNKAYSNKGYSNWIFIIMITIGLLLNIIYPLINLLSGIIILKSQCHINTKNLEFEYKSINPSEFIDYTPPDISVFLVAFVYICWDTSTLLLYIFKIRSFKRVYKETQPNVYQRILSILYKIVILTLFYQIELVIITIGGSIITEFLDDIAFTILSTLGICINSITISLAMYLMLPHNMEQYAKFLKIVYWFKCHYVCCCYRNMVIEQLNELTSDVDEKNLSDVVGVDNGDYKTGKRQSRKSFETGNNSVPIKHINSNGFELSLETVTEQK